MEDKNITVEKIVEICKGTIISRGTASTIKKYSCDTRKMEKGDLFVSLKSENNNGIENIEKAFKLGAIGCITEYDIPQEIVEIDAIKQIIDEGDDYSYQADI